jgi:tetratricopeptide (TPR) repeat protein
MEKGVLYSVRARVQYQLGRYPQAMDDLEAVVKEAPDSADKEFMIKGSEPEGKDAFLWGIGHLDDLVQKFPTDYRARVYRGIYLSFFTIFNQKYRQQAIQELQKAIALNSRSAISHFLLAKLYAPDLSQLGSEAESAAAWQKAIPEYTAAITLDATLVPAVRQRANAYYGLKQSRLALADYDKAVRLDPDDSGTYNDRALVKMDVRQYYSAITDFGLAIEKDKNPDDLFSTLHFESRADAYIKVADYPAAVKDLTKALQMTLTNDTFLMSLANFRAIYPEYKTVSDETIVRKLQSLFWPQFTYDVLLKQLSGNSDFTDSRLADLYLKRGDAYLNAGNFSKAVTDYNRVFSAFGEYGKSMDRWRPLGTSTTGECFVDARTVEISNKGVSRVWLKTTNAKTSTYSVDAYEVDCATRRINQASTLLYNSDGGVIRGTDSAINWQRIVPDTMGEQLYFGLCNH